MTHIITALARTQKKYRDERDEEEGWRPGGIVLSHFPSSIVQVTGEGKELATISKEASFE